MSLFDEELNENEKEKYVEFLRRLGYVVIEPKKLNPTSVRSAAAMVDYFYALLQYYNRDRKIHYSKSVEIDRRKANNFIKSRMESGGCSRQRAINECVEIIKCVVEHEDNFYLSEPLHSFDCFGQGNMRWVTDKAISIINNENDKVKKEDLSTFIDCLSIKQEEEALSSFHENIDELKDILGGLQDGQKKKQ